MPTTSAKWKYCAIYSNDAQRIGQWNNIAEIVVVEAFKALQKYTSGLIEY